MQRSPVPCTNRHVEYTVRTRSAWKSEQKLNKMQDDLMRKIHSDLPLSENHVNTQPIATDGNTIVKSHHSEKQKSEKSAKSLEARKQQLKYEAAKAEAEIKTKLIQEKLAADLAALEYQSTKSHRSAEDQSVLNSVGRVEEWLSHNREAETNNINQQQDEDCNRAGMEHLVSAMYQANTQNQQLLSRFTTSKDLPCFYGDSLEWLAFKQAFDESSNLCKYGDTENMWRLRKSLRGEARETVSSLLIGNTAPRAVIEALELRYGRPETIINKITYQLRKMPPLPQNYHNEIVAHSIKIKNFVAAAQAINQTDYLRSPELVTSVLSKWPTALINKWSDYYSANYENGKAKFELLAEFLYDEAKKISAAGLSHIHSQADYKKKYEFNRKQYSVLLSETGDSPVKCKFCRINHHKLTECARFKRAMTKDRWRFVRTNRLCHKCLLAPHNRDTCPAAACDVDNCELPHHRLLHWKLKTRIATCNNENEQSQTNIDNNVVSDDIPTKSCLMIDNAKRVLLKVVPINVHGPKGMISTFALLDDGATVTFISADLADFLGLHGSKETMCVRGAWDTELQCQSEVIELKISNMDNETFDLTARKISELNLPTQNSHINLKNYEHLSKLTSYISCHEKIKPKLLIGQDNYHLIAPVKSLIGDKNEPCATLTPLGWCVHGVCPQLRHSKLQDTAVLITQLVPTAAAYTEEEDHSNSLGASTHKHIIDSLVKLHELVRKSFTFESIGVNQKPRQNKHHLKAISAIDKSASLVEGRWHVGLPWKDENIKMVDSYCQAYRRLMIIERKMLNEEGFASRYKERVEHLFANQYARKIEPTEEQDSKYSKIWYLPHFGVDNPNKKKLRLVYDAAATSAGQSLNDYLLTGPNVLESLLGIMLRFREKPIGLAGDIKDMFMRIKIRPQDQHAFRFLWRGRDNPKDILQKYVMTSLIFGANCSPFIAQHIKNKNALRYAAEMPEAVEAIVKNHFMDDYIDCFDCAEIALKRMKEVSHIHQQGGFEMRNWSSNDLQVCQGIPNEILSPAAVQFKVDETSNLSERTLGLLWYQKTDSFGFNLTLHRIPNKILTCEKRPTKRELLRIVMSIFDLYGLLAPFTIRAKIIMQTCWKSNLKWDEEINNTQYELFREWIVQLQQLKDLRLPRWYFHLSNETSGDKAKDKRVDRKMTTRGMNETLQLHVFCDASPAAFSAVAYWRAHDENTVSVSFIISKSRVAPVKPVTIPRLELQAAVLACRLAETIQREHRLKPTKRYFWTDSTTVLHWIKNEDRNYNIFVANRLGEIDELSSIHEWHYIPTDKNIADLATKHNSYKFHGDCEWLRGPTFLHEKEEDWISGVPENTEIHINDCLLEIVQNVYKIDCNNIPVPDLHKFSSWLRLLRCTATMLLFIEKCKKTCKTEIDTDMCQKAEILLLRHSQIQSFSDEIHLLKDNKPIKANSRLRTLTPYLDELGLLRVGGRVEAVSSVLSDVKRPIILDGRHIIARLITKSYHEKLAHGNNEMVVNELRQNYWLLNLRPTVRTVASKCLICRIRKAEPIFPRMADLPEGRLAHHERAFTHCGVDLFGPMEITVCRHKERRYGVLFTCMTVRAVHIEMVPSLTADSFIMALRRMASRRGWPKFMYSDNGTNLRGAEAELRKSYQDLDGNRVKDEMTNRGVQWTFISPNSPHKGGAWERLIRSVKTALKVVLKERAPQEETLATFLSEIENIINGRPLTHVSVDPRHMEALTPNHFLIGSSSNLPVPGVFDDGDLYLRKRWRIAQRLADMFWQRWLKEVLPTLIPRQKWYQEGRNMKVGDVVIIMDPNLPRNTWPKGVVEQVYSGKDDRIRTVAVKTKAGVLTRPVARLALLPMVD